MSVQFQGKVAIVTGAGSRGPGIGNGKAAAILFAREGARVLCVDADAARAQETGVRVDAIAVGMVWTPTVSDLGPEMRERRRQASPLGTEGTGRDVGWAAVYLASDEARWVTGHTLVVDSGVTLTTR
jgi:NAD(P)-dependent dehydrogenase (short-subunit alcohol dehydrogenase family)